MKKTVIGYMWSFILLLVGAMSLTSCGKIKELLETPEYPDSDFSIVGTWEYHIPPNIGTAPIPGAVYNATGRITFTEDMRFCFTIDTDKGEVKGYGTYTYNEDSGLYLTYAEYVDIEEYASLHHVIVPSYHASFTDGINWGNEGDEVSSDYLKVHSTLISEYHRVATESYEEIILPYHREDDYGFVTHKGECCVNLPVSLDELYNIGD